VPSSVSFNSTKNRIVRHAIALGLHLRVGAGIDGNQQQVRSCTWWSLYGLEQLLGDFTGRPTSILDTDIAVPLDLIHKNELDSKHAGPFPTSDGAQEAILDQSGRGLHELQYSPHLYFVWRIRLSVLGHKIRSSLYASGRMSDAWSRIQKSIRGFDKELTQWSADLPKEIDLPQGIDVESSDRRGGQLHDHLELAMAYQSTRMILFRPCLCHLEGVIPHESARSRSFNQEAALLCVAAARTLLALLPDEAGKSYTSKKLPWWSLLHYITQAGAVLLLELCLKAEHMPSQVKTLLADVRKVMAWLAEMAAESLSAWRSWKIFRKLSLQAAAGVGIDFMIPQDVQKPPEWKAVYDQHSGQQLNLQMLNHPHQQAEIAPVPSSSALFPVDRDISSEPWQILSSMSNPDGDLAFSPRHAYLRSPGNPADKMDWRV
jgi:hypothetical protein